MKTKGSRKKRSWVRLGEDKGWWGILERLNNSSCLLNRHLVDEGVAVRQ
jgi:hypothetical protein